MGLLFYNPPILVQFLPPDYSNDFALLVTAMHILLGCNVLKEDVDAAHEMLELFYNLMPQLYPEEMLSPSLHRFIHLSRCVHELGPLGLFMLWL